MAVPVLSVDNQQSIPMLLSSFNEGVTLGLISNTTINGANTYATLVSRIQANIIAATTTSEAAQAGNMIVLRSFPAALALGIITDTNLNSKTTVAGVQALYTESAPAANLPLAYTGSNIS